MIDAMGDGMIIMTSSLALLVDFRLVEKKTVALELGGGTSIPLHSLLRVGGAPDYFKRGDAGGAGGRPGRVSLQKVGRATWRI